MKYKIKAYNIWEIGPREKQEDSIFPAYKELDDSDRLFILCDGMGGHSAGEIASSTVCEAMSDSVFKQCPDPEGDFTDDNFHKALSDAFSVLDTKDNGAAKKMGTTLTFLKLHNQGCTIAHIGDSRVYHIRPGKGIEDSKILFQTEDHSLVNDLVKVGELTPEEAKHSKQKNIITRAMQPNMERKSRADIYHSHDIKAGDYFMLCSDGILENMEDDNIKYIFSSKGGDDLNKVDMIIKATEHNNDNHSAIIIHVLDVIDPVAVCGTKTDEIHKETVVLTGEIASTEVKSTTENVSRGRKKTKMPKEKIYKILNLAAIFVILCVGAFYLFSNDSENNEPTPKSPLANNSQPASTQEPCSEEITANNTHNSSLLNITTTPEGATVYIDGNEIGVTPIENYAVKPGTHKVEVTKDGYELFSDVRNFGEEPVNINNLQLKEVEMSLVDFISTPAGASVSLNGTNIGKTPITGYKLKSGKYEVEITKSGYAPNNTTHTFDTKGDRVEVTLTKGQAPSGGSSSGGSSSSGSSSNSLSGGNSPGGSSSGSSSNSSSRNQINGHEYVDLDLSVKWATCNIGASSPSDYGDYFAWGETSPKDEYTAQNCDTYGKPLQKIVGDPAYDAAAAIWGGGWRLPSQRELNELRTKCKWEWTSVNGTNGYRVTSKNNGNSIFLPAAGYKGEVLNEDKEHGYYWISKIDKYDTQAHLLEFSNCDNGRYVGFRYVGQSIRPVVK